MLEGLDAGRLPADAPARARADAQRLRRQRGRHAAAADGRRRRARPTREVGERVDRLCRALESLGISRATGSPPSCGTRRSTSRPTWRVPCMGAVLHTLNIRLFPEQLTYIANHAEDQVVIVDDSLVPVLEQLAPTLRDRARTRRGRATATPGSLPNVHPLRGAARRRRPTASTGPSSTSATPPASATRAARPATPRAWSTPTARLPALDGGVHDRRRSALAPDGPGAADRADVPRERLGPAVRLRMVGARWSCRTGSCRPSRWPADRGGAASTVAGAVPTIWKDLLRYAGRARAGPLRACATVIVRRLGRARSR